MYIISEQYGRFGNNIYQLLNILLEADKQNDNIDLSVLYYLTPIINIKKLEILFNSIHKKKNIINKQHFMPKDLHLVNKRNIDLSKFFILSNKYIQQCLNCNIEPLDSNICLIHIRSGDEFGNHISHSAYVQPPLNYYKKIINDTEHLYKKYIIITEPDLENPCIKLLNGYKNKVEIKLNTVFNDYNLLLKTQSIILSRSSFSDSSIFISPNIKNIYFWNYGHNLCDTSIIPSYINISKYNLTEKYIEMGEWTHSQSQLDLMINYKIENIIKI